MVKIEQKNSIQTFDLEHVNISERIIDFFSKAFSPVSAACAVFLLMLTRVLYFYLASDSKLVGVISDDAFYYIQMARHRIAEGFWTFDGTSVATGFHFLYGYFLAAIYYTLDGIGWRNLYLLVGLFSAFAISLSAFFVCRTVVNVFDRRVIPIVIAPFISTAAMIQSTVMMESWMVLFLSSLTIYLLSVDRPTTHQGALGLILIGIFGSLARTDFGLLPGVFFCMYLLSHKSGCEKIKKSGVILIGAVSGVLIVLAHNYLISGHFSQASVQTKFYWSSISGHSIKPAMGLVKYILVPDLSILHGFKKASITYFSLALMISSALFLSARKSEKNWKQALVLSFGCTITIIGYIVFYRYNSQSIQIWYAANFIAPIAIGLSSIFHFAFRSRSFIPALIGLTFYVIACLSHVFVMPWPHQSSMMQAGISIKHLNSSDRYASWNAGIISYFSQKPVINIDGLTNDEVLPYIKSNRLFEYFKEKKIGYVVDFKAMVEEVALRIRGGYNCEKIDKILTPLNQVDGDLEKWGDSHIFIFKVNQDCL